MNNKVKTKRTRAALSPRNPAALAANMRHAGRMKDVRDKRENEIKNDKYHLLYESEEIEVDVYLLMSIAALIETDDLDGLKILLPKIKKIIS